MLLSSIITNFKIVIKNMFIPQKFLKAVLIIGPGFPGSSKDLEVLKSIYNREGYLIIGDGDREGYITDDQIKALKGQINSKTRIDVYVHGGKSPEGFLQLQFNANADTASNFFELLSEVNSNDPLCIHLWCCHSGLGSKSFSDLPNKSVLVTHAPGEFEAVSSFNSEAFPKSIGIFQQRDGLPRENYQIAAIQDFLMNFPYECLSHPSITTSLGGEIFHAQVEPKVESLFQNPQSTLHDLALDIAENFQEFYIKSSLQAPDLTIPNFSKLELETLQAGCLMYSFMTEPDQEKTLSILKDLPVEFLNRKIGGESFFMMATATGRDQIVEFLLNKEGVIIDDNSDLAPMIYVAVQGLAVSTISNKYNIVKLLLEKGFDPNILTRYQDSPLGRAIEKGYTEIVQLLLDFDAKVDLVDNNGYLPIHNAALRGHADIVRILISKGVDINAVNKDQDTPLYVSARQGHAETVKLLVDLGADLSKSREGCCTQPFHIAVFNNHIEAFKVLMPRVESSEFKSFVYILKLLGNPSEHHKLFIKLMEDQINGIEMDDVTSALEEVSFVGEGMDENGTNES